LAAQRELWALPERAAVGARGRREASGMVGCCEPRMHWQSCVRRVGVAPARTIAGSCQCD